MSDAYYTKDTDGLSSNGAVSCQSSFLLYLSLSFGKSLSLFLVSWKWPDGRTEELACDYFVPFDISSVISVPIYSGSESTFFPRYVECFSLLVGLTPFHLYNLSLPLFLQAFIFITVVAQAVTTSCFSCYLFWPCSRNDRTKSKFALKL